ncbi:MAG: hypothetical protein WD069_07325 [Planctomycetales bacterium]
MYRLIGILFSAALGGGLVYFSLQYHLVRADEGFLVVPKRNAAFSEIYVDVREWSPLEWERHPALVEGLVRHGRGDIVRTSAGRSLFRGLFDRFDPSAADALRKR